ncbi:MAG TPA: hypothetical protein VKT99_17040 [Xanthobacteraceae bacterium]|nr:hypothetical protein [Xanthobacteraceae bacterium]
MGDDAANEADALGVRNNPVEEIALDRSEDSRRLKPSPGQDARRIVLVHVQNGKRNRLGDDDQERMLEKKLIAFHLAPINELVSVAKLVDFARARQVMPVSWA